MNLVVTIDVEEDNWGSFNAIQPTVENIRTIPQLQAIFDRYEIRPTYLVTYPVVATAWATAVLSDILQAGKCEIGAHLHPWNTAPFREDINERNSMLKNLPYELQTAKIKVITDKIHSVFGRKPLSFRAGRWGLGPKTVQALIACGYQADCSVTPSMSWTHCGDGPDYTDSTTEPYWLYSDDDTSQDAGAILEVPATIGFNRWPFERWQKVFCRLQKTWTQRLRPIGFFHHTGLLRKIWLSPEWSSAKDMITLSRVMIRNEARVLNLSFHSSTLLPGATPFVKNARELEGFIAKIETLFEFLSANTPMTALTLSEVANLYQSGKSKPGAEQHCHPDA